MNIPNRENNVSRVGNINGKLGNNSVSATKIFLNLLGNIFASWEANFVSAIMFLEVGKQGNIDSRKHNVSATMFPSLPVVCPSFKDSYMVTKQHPQIFLPTKYTSRIFFHKFCVFEVLMTLTSFRLKANFKTSAPSRVKTKIESRFKKEKSA